MHPPERNAPFSNPLIHSSSPYLRQHAHNPVFWYPWGKEALDRAKAENKPILLSIGYSTCYWCHVMEREVFENVSIASLMNRDFINIKIDREEHPQLDEIYMVARQMLTQEGGWPNNVFLTPDLKPFYAGGTYAPDESYNKPAFPRLLEWLNYAWTTQNEDVLANAESITAGMRQFLVHTPPENAPEATIPQQSRDLFAFLDKQHDERAGGFFQAPKFPHECYLQFLLGYYEMAPEEKQRTRALDMVTRSLSRMAAGGLHDQVGCGFHRYAVDKEWYIPHFEKMLYNQAQLAKLYTEAARLTGNPYFADIARSTLEFVGGPLTSGNGAFYAGIDAETDGVEGAHYAWKAEELKAILTEEEILVLTAFYALADIPAFPGHKHPDGQALIARKPLDAAARENNMPYVQLAAFSAKILNKLLAVRNQRPAPRLDDKIITSWNGLMIDAFATAGLVLKHPGYTARAREAADFILEHCIDNEARLHRIHAAGRPQHLALLEDYACLIKGLLSLYRATNDAATLTSATDLMARAKELFASEDGSYFLTEPSDDLLFRIKSADDSSIPSACGLMLHNMLDLFTITGEETWRTQAKALADCFLKGATLSPERATFLHAALRLEILTHGTTLHSLPVYYTEETAPQNQQAPDEIVEVTAELLPADATPGQRTIIATLNIRKDWHINANKPLKPYLVPTQAEIQGEGVELLGIDYPEPTRISALDSASANETLLVYEGNIAIPIHIRLPESKLTPPLRLQLSFQPCRAQSCYAARNIVITIE